MPRPEQGKVVVVDTIPGCDFCEQLGPYDFKTSEGPWAHGCYQHYRYYAQYGELGVGKAQLWITEDEVDDATG
jgi:hypothetical protein